MNNMKGSIKIKKLDESLIVEEKNFSFNLTSSHLMNKNCLAKKSFLSI